MAESLPKFYSSSAKTQEQSSPTYSFPAAEHKIAELFWGILVREMFIWIITSQEEACLSQPI